MKKKLLFYAGKAKLVRDIRAVAAVEFALVFPLFFFFLMGFIEFGFIMFGNAVLDSVVTRASRRGMVGCIERECGDAAKVQTIASIKEQIRTNSIGLIDPDGTNEDGSPKFNIAIQPVNDLAGDLAGEPAWGTENMGNGGDLVVYAVEYDWSVFLPLPTNIIGFHDEFFTFTFATVVRNEEFQAGGI